MTSNRFSEGFCIALGDFITYILGAIGYRDWQIVLLDEPCDPEAGASVDFIYGRRVANLKLAWDFFANPRETQAHYLMHEMCHLFCCAMDDVIDNGPSTVMGMPAFTIFHENYKLAMENAVDNMARAMLWGVDDGPEYNRLLDALVASELRESQQSVDGSSTIIHPPENIPGGPDEGELHGQSQSGIDRHDPGVTLARGIHEGSKDRTDQG
jgi:hypothetical protein